MASKKTLLLKELKERLKPKESPFIDLLDSLYYQNQVKKQRVDANAKRKEEMALSKGI